jgi:hypothetical protein
MVLFITTAVKTSNPIKKFCRQVAVNVNIVRLNHLWGRIVVTVTVTSTSGRYQVWFLTYYWNQNRHIEHEHRTLLRVCEVACLLKVRCTLKHVLDKIYYISSPHYVPTTRNFNETSNDLTKKQQNMPMWWQNRTQRDLTILCDPLLNVYKCAWIANIAAHWLRNIYI